MCGPYFGQSSMLVTGMRKREGHTRRYKRHRLNHCPSSVSSSCHLHRLACPFLVFVHWLYVVAHFLISLPTKTMLCLMLNAFQVTLCGAFFAATAVMVFSPHLKWCSYGCRASVVNVVKCSKKKKKIPSTHYRFSRDSISGLLIVKQTANVEDSWARESHAAFPRWPQLQWPHITPHELMYCGFPQDCFFFVLWPDRFLYLLCRNGAYQWISVFINFLYWG